MLEQCNVTFTSRGPELTFAKDEWLADSGSSTHLVMKCKMFREFIPTTRTLNGINENNSTTLYGIILHLKINGKIIPITLHNVLFTRCHCRWDKNMYPKKLKFYEFIPWKYKWTCISGLTPGGRRFMPSSNKMNDFSHLCKHNTFYSKAIHLKLTEIQLNCGYLPNLGMESIQTHSQQICNLKRDIISIGKASFI